MTLACPFRALLLDVDGTLIDSNAAHAESWRQALHEHGLEVDLTSVRRLIGMGGDKLLPAVANVELESALGQVIDERRKKIFSERLPGLQPTKGARDLLAALRDSGVALVIATSASDDEVKALLKQAGVHDLLPTRTSKDDAEASKPDPDIVAAALARSKHSADETAMIGDTPYDIEAADRTGVKSIALRCGGYWPDEDLRGAADIFDDPSALLARWARG